MDCHSVFSSCAHVNWDKSNPHRKEYQHTESDEPCFIKIVWQFPGQKGHEEAHAGKEANVPENTPEADL